MTNNLFKLTTKSLIQIDNIVWFAARNINGLFILNLDNLETEYILELKEPDKYTEDLVLDIFCKDTTLYLIPSRASGIWVYEYENETLEYKKLPIEYTKNSYKFVSSELVNDHIYMYPEKGGTILIYDICREEYIFSVSEYKLMPSIKNRDNSDNNLFEIGDKTVYKLDSQMNILEQIPILTEDRIYCLHCCKNMIVIAVENNILIYDIEYKLIDKISYEGIITSLIYWSNKLLGFCTDGRYYIINIEEKEAILGQPISSIQDWGVRKQYGGIGIGIPVEYKENLYVIPGDYGCILKFDKDFNVIDEKTFGIEQEKVAEYFNNRIDENGSISENENIDLDFLINYCLVK